MSKNVETVSKIYEAFGTGNIPAILETLSDEVRWEDWRDNYAQKAGVPWMAKQHGKEGALEFFKIIGSSFAVKGFQVISIMEGTTGGTNQVAVEFTIEADVPSTGGYFFEEEIHLWTFDDSGKVIRFRHYLDTAKHIKAAGL